MPEVKKSTIRLTEADVENIEKIIAAGAAQGEAEAIRIGLAIAGHFFAVRPGQASELRLISEDGVDRGGVRWTRPTKKR